MDIAENGEDVVLTLTRDELDLITSSVGEAIEAVDDWEFQTRLGYDKDEARQLQSQLNSLLAKIRRPQ